MVAGSLPPLDESYRPDLVPNEDDSIPIYVELIDELNSFVDIFLCETVSSIAETSNVLKALKNKAKQDKKIWLSWTLLEDKSGRLRSKETIEDAFQLAESFNPDAYLFNCTDPIAITEGIKKLSKLTNKPIGIKKFPRKGKLSREFFLSFLSYKLRESAFDNFFSIRNYSFN